MSAIRLARPIRVWIADASEFNRFGLLSVLQRCGEVDVRGDSESLDDLLEVLADEPIDVVIVDPNQYGARAGALETDPPYLSARVEEVVTRIRNRSPETKILVWAASITEATGRLVLSERVDGCLLKDAREEELVAAIKNVHGGHVSLDGETARWVMAHVREAGDASRTERVTSLAALDAREIDVLRMVSEGFTNRRIAEMCGESPQKIDHAVRKLYRKLRVSRRSEAAALGARLLRDEL